MEDALYFINQFRADFAPVWAAYFAASKPSEEDARYDAETVPFMRDGKRGSAARQMYASMLLNSLRAACADDIPIAEALQRNGLDPITLERL